MTKRINAPDTAADITLRKCLDKSPRVSFNMIAGAGSGKTTSLVKALNHIITTKGDALRRQGQQVACITYTEIAAKEIWNEVGNNALVHVSTIHSFLWTVIKPFQKDIKKWVLGNIIRKTTDLETKMASYGPRVQQQTKDKDAKQHEKLKSTFLSIDKVSYFNYGTGSNYLKGILGHDDIITLVPAMIQDRPMLNAIVSQKFPYVFVDESQDTFPAIISAFKKIDTDHKGKFCLGFFGDPMQKIYPTGVGDIPVEADWQTIKKPENFRCSKNVLDLINAIRKQSDGLQQAGGRIEIEEGEAVPVQGSAQIFILPADDHRTENLQKVKEWCSKKFGDDSWNDDSKIKIFVIVHRMAAIRLGFPHLYSAMNDDAPSSFKDGFLDGSSWPLKPFLKFILPLVQKNLEGQKFEVASIARANSPKLIGENLKSPDLPNNMKTIKKEIDKLTEMMKDGSTATVLDVFKLAHSSELTVLDSTIVDHMNNTVKPEEAPEGEEDPIVIEIAAMKKYFTCPANELWGYKKYFESESPFATQQGVKGAEFDKVLTILDDEEGTHRQFSYDKYFGVADLSKIDSENIAQGKDSVIDRTRRLFYVSCSRAKKELAVVYYTGDTDNAIVKVTEMGIFPKDGILTLKDFFV
jgi:DNA helicase II / ATP-dependent DNA helicase PcrA